MKEISKYILEKLVINSNVKGDKPKVGETAYDWNGVKCEIKAIASTDDFDACEDIANEWCDEHDQYYWDDYVKENNITRKSLREMTPYIVGVVITDKDVIGNDEPRKCWYEWGKNGIQYENPTK